MFYLVMQILNRLLHKEKCNSKDINDAREYFEMLLTSSKFTKICVFLRNTLLKIDFCDEISEWRIIQYVGKISRKIDISYPAIRTRTCADQDVRTVSFLENYAYVLNDWSLSKQKLFRLLLQNYSFNLVHITIRKLQGSTETIYLRMDQVKFVKERL